MLRAHHCGVTVDLDPLFDDVTLTLSPGDRVGLVGPNGSGKSTLLRVLAGLQPPMTGSVVRSPGLVVGWQSQEAPDSRMTVADLVASGAPALTAAHARMRRAGEHLAADRTSDRTSASVDHRLQEYAAAHDAFEVAGGWSALATFDEVRSRLEVGGTGRGTGRGIDGARMMSSLSGGEQSRVMLARLLVSDPDVLLLDEPTNHLDLEGRRWLAGYLRGFHGAVVLASHDRRFLDESVTRVIELDEVRPQLQDYPGGGYTAYRLERQRRWERLLLDFEAQEKHRRQLCADIERTKEQARGVELANPRNPGARRLARKVARKALSRERRLAREMAAASWVREPRSRPPLVLAAGPRAVPGCGESANDNNIDDRPVRLLALRGVDVKAGGRTVLGGVDVHLDAGDRILVSGPNGAGKTSLVRTLLAHLPDALLLPQTHDQLPQRTSALDYFRSQVAMYEDEAQGVLGGFLIDSHDQTRLLPELSVGQLRRLLIAALVNRQPRVLVLDEPTNHLDFESLEVVEEALRQFSGALLVVSHDEEFAERIGVTRRWQVDEGRLESAA